LERREGSLADPPSFETTVLVWRAGDSIPLGRNRSLRAIETRPALEPDQPAVLVVGEDRAEEPAA